MKASASVSHEAGAGGSEQAPAGRLEKVHQHYGVYGRLVCSTLWLPELMRADFRTGHVVFRFTTLGTYPPALPHAAELLVRRATNLGCDLTIFRSEQAFLLRWEGLCDYIVSASGSEIQCFISPSVSYGWVTATLYGIVLSFALHLQGIGNLHASAAALPAGAVAFLADPGSGKSTLAATFVANGYPFITDDVLALREGLGEYTAQPGFPYVSLSQQAIEMLLPAERSLHIPPNHDKARVAVDGLWGSFCAEPTPLTGLFSLDRGEHVTRVRIDRLPPAEAIRCLLENTNCLPMLPPGVQRRQLGFVTRLAAVVPVYRLSYPNGLTHLPEVVRQVTSLIENSRIAAAR